MVADETRLAEMKRVRAVTEDIEYVKNEKRDVRRVRDIPRVTVRILDTCWFSQVFLNSVSHTPPYLWSENQRSEAKWKMAR